MFTVHSAIQHAFVFKLPATKQQSVIPRVSLIFITALLLGERDHWGDPGVDGRIILRWIFRI